MAHNGSKRGGMYYAGAFWIVAIIVLLIILVFAWWCTRWNDDDFCDGKSFHDKKCNDDQKSYRRGKKTDDYSPRDW